MGLFGNNSTVTTTFKGKDDLSPVVRGVRSTMEGFKRDAVTGFGLAGGISIFNAATAAIGFVTDAVADGTKAFREDQLSQVQLRAALEANIDSWDGNAEAIEKVIASRMRLGYSDDEQRQSLALLVAQVQDINDALAIQRTAMDFARLKGISLADASTTLAKAYNGSATGLQRMGIQLRKGAKGMEAIEAVQKRAAGQAETYAQSNVGAIDAMNVKVGELQESIGAFVAGPANSFVDFLAGVVDVLDGPDGANKQVKDMAAEVRNLYKAAEAGSDKLPWDKMAEGVQRAREEFEQLRYAIPEVYAPLIEALGPETRYSLGATTDSLADLADAAVRTGYDFRFLVDEAISSRAGANILSDAWTGAAGEVSGAGADIRLTMRSLPNAAFHAVTDMESTIKDGKAGIIEQMRDLAWQTKHPFAQVRYEDWLRGRMKAAIRKMKQAERQGHPGLVEQYRQLVQDIKAELEGLPGYTAGLAADVIADLASIGTTVTGLMGYGEDGHATPVPKKGGRKGGRRNRKAIGGTASGEFVVGEYGPEVIRSGSAKAHVTPSHAGRGDIVLQIDGYTLMRWIDNRMGRQMAFSGLGD